jgi:hypothetical protein
VTQLGRQLRCFHSDAVGLNLQMAGLAFYSDASSLNSTHQGLYTFVYSNESLVHASVMLWRCYSLHDHCYYTSLECTFGEVFSAFSGLSLYQFQIRSELKLPITHDRPQLLHYSFLLLTLGLPNGKVETSLHSRIPVTRVSRRYDAASFLENDPASRNVP